MQINNPEQFRENIRKKINKIVRKKKSSINVEKGIYNWTIIEAKRINIVRKWTNCYFVMLYSNKFRSVYLNLNPKSLVKNPNLLKKIKKKKIKPRELAFMTHQEMYPEIWKPLINAKLKRDKNATKINLAAATDEFTCFKCKKSQTTYYQLQTRSADEPMTTFINCLNCGNRWKQ